MATKETLDLIAFLEGLSVAINAAKADSSVDWKDARHLAPLLLIGREAIKGGEQIIEEMKGANGEEIQDVMERFIYATTSLLDALLK